MIVKSFTRKKACFRQLLEYMTKSASPDHEPLLFNLRSNSHLPNELEKEFLDNSRYAVARKNGVMMYHEILSLGSGDQAEVTADMLDTLALQYLEMRAPHALAVGVTHFDASNPHLHLLISGNEIESQKQSRISRARFTKIKKELEHRQQELYPFLEHSIAFPEHGYQTSPSIRVRKTAKEYEQSRRLGAGGSQATNKKTKIGMMVGDFLQRADDEQTFKEWLAVSNLALYHRGRQAGIQCQESKRKYRLSTLGINFHYEKAQQRWRQVDDLASNLIKIQQRQCDKDRSLDSTEFSTRR
jgi:hypothetical protein